MRELTDIDVIRDVLGRHGFHFSKSKGQNFLTAAWVPEEIVERAGLDENTGVLEIGPGLGSLTVKLSEAAGKVLAVELDETLMPVLAETLQGCENTEVLFGNILKKDVAQLVEENFQGLRPVVCANLPYNVTSPVLAQLLESRAFRQITVMVQKEVAQRICAGAGNKEYSAFSILCQWYAEPELLFDVSPDCFTPRPKVTSSVLQLTTRPSPPEQVLDEKLFFRIVRAAFNQRRKTLPNALASGVGEFTKQELQNIIVETGFSENIRGEALSIHDFAQIANALTQR